MLVTDLERRYRAVLQELFLTEQILGEALGFPRYVDDPKNFPEATEADGVCTGDYASSDLAQLLANRYAESKRRVTMKIANIIRVEDVVFLPKTSEWSGMDVEVEFEMDADGEVVMTPRSNSEISIRLMTAEWRIINKFVEDEIDRRAKANAKAKSASS